MIKGRNNVLAWLIVGIPCLLCGQATAPPLTLQDARAMALKNHPQVLASEANSLRAGEVVTEARSAYFPALNGEITGAAANVDSRLGAGVINDPRLFNHFGSGVTLSQLITDSGRTPNLVANARFQAQASQQDYQATRYDIILAVSQAYYEVLLSQELIKVAQGTVAARQTVVDQVTELTKNQLKSQLDLSFAQVNLSDAQLMLIRARDRLATAYASLGQALGTNQATPYQVTPQPMPPNPPDSADPLIAQAFANRPELASLRLQREAAQKFVYAERDLRRPTVSLMAAGGVLPYIDPGNANPNIPEEYGVAALNVQIPVFNGHLFAARRRAAEYELRATDQRVRDLQDRIARDVRASWEHARTAFEAIAPSQQLLAQANMALNLSQGRYNLGLASIVELTQAQLSQTQAQVQNLTAQYDYQEAYAVLQYALGLLH
ncbi:MAG TPA: TolC family protein [Bryobacteraceae bacterium]|nr:TolC family protein [Bryobacteraceae bacterium]